MPEKDKGIISYEQFLSTRCFSLDADTIGRLIAAGLFLAAVIAAIVLVLRIRAKIRRYSREMFDTDSLIDGIKSLKAKQTGNAGGRSIAVNPASLNGMDRVYVPKINADFPGFQLAAVIPQVETVVKTFLDSVEEQDVGSLSKLTISPSLVDRAQEIITDLKSQKKRVFYDNIVVHRTVISEYVKEHGMVIIRFQSAVGYVNYVLDENGNVTDGSRDITEETVYVTSYARILDSELARQSGAIDIIGLNCPNCGAPLRSSKLTRCEFCGTGIGNNLTEDVFGWTFTDIKEKNSMTKKFY